MARELLKGRVAIITGAGQGLGYAIAKEYAAEGATVALIERDQDALERAQDDIGNALAYELDVTDYETYGRAIADVAEKAGHIDILVNNAAIAFYGTILEDTLDSWRKQLSVNLEAVYMGTKMTVPYMVDQNFGRRTTRPRAVSSPSPNRLPSNWRRTTSRQMP
jgi:NAD(P)-dependent dehydrogenase (short-subunit alcohol dehydrogenase family)